MQRIAFFGGSFDPPHRGHLAIAKAAADNFALDQVLFAPVGAQPLKSNCPAASFVDRYAMTALAVSADPRFIPSLLDAPAGGDSARPNYTIETFARLRGSFPQETLLFTLLGADSWLGIARWYDPARLLAASDWIIASRPGFSLAAAEHALPEQVVTEQVHDAASHSLRLLHSDGSATRAFFLPTVWEDVSATGLRAALATGADCSASLSEEVQDYIRKTALYRHPGAPVSRSERE